MTEKLTPDDSRSAPATTTPLPHLAARLSIISAFTCFATNCVGNRLLFQAKDHARYWDLLLGSITTGCILGGILLGAIGLIGGLRTQRPDTIVMSFIGLTLNIGTVLVMVFMLVVLWQ